MKVVAVIQARMGSSRLPGKVMMDLAGKPMLAWVVERVWQASSIDVAVVATTMEGQDNAIVRLCDYRWWPSFRGSEDDVLDRFYWAAREYHADAVVRICADCPLIDPEVIDLVVQAFRDERVDYASNTMIRTYPRGLDVSVTSMDALSRAWHEAAELHQRAHVTAYVYRHPELFRLLAVTGDEDYSSYRWTVDEPADLDFVRAIYDRLGHLDTFGWRDVLEVLAREPELAELNSQVNQKELEAG